MLVTEIKNGLQVNRAFDEFKVQGFYQSSEMLENVMGFRYFLKCRTRVRSFVVQEENNDMVLFHTRIRSGTCYLLGSIECFDYVDCIYGDISLQKLTEAIDAFFSYLRGKGIKKFCVRFLDENSNTYTAIKKIKKDIDVISEDDVENVSIFLREESYEEYFASLGKHAKQNIRTAYNRMIKDNLNYKSEFLFGGVNKNLLHKKCMKVYQDRLKSRYGSGIITRFGHYADYVSNGSVKSNGIVCALMIDGEIAAFLEGFIDKKSMLVPRLAINEKFKRYSPGLVLCNEIIKDMFQSKDFKCLNLLRGTEKYKYDLGGKTYITKNMQINLKKNVKI